jgi:hypothetical protein
MGRPFTTEEDAEILRLKEGGGASWAALAQHFSTTFPQSSRSRGDLQVRYSRYLSEKQKGKPFRARAQALLRSNG